MKVRMAKLVRERGRELLEEPNVVVGDETHRSAAEGRQPLDVGRAHVAQQILQHREWILALQTLGAVSPKDLARDRHEVLLARERDVFGEGGAGHARPDAARPGDALPLPPVSTAWRSSRACLRVVSVTLAPARSREISSSRSFP